MAKTKTRKPRQPKREKKPRQRRLSPDWGNEVHPDIDQAAEIYDTAIQDRLPYTQAEADAKNNLISKMKEHGLQLHKTPDGIIVTLTATDKVSLKKVKPDPADQPEE